MRRCGGEEGGIGNATKLCRELERLLGHARCAVALGVLGGTMSNELLPSPDILAAPVNDVEHADNDIVAAGQDLGVPADYASGRRPDAQALADTFARLEAVLREPLEASADISGRLSSLLATIERIEAVLRSGDNSAPNVHFAIEHIQDIAMALRQREVEPALCDTLEAAIREVGDAIVRNDAAAARAQGATALLGDLARRVTNLIALAASVEKPAREPGRPSAEVAAPNDRPAPVLVQAFRRTGQAQWRPKEDQTPSRPANAPPQRRCARMRRRPLHG